MIKICVKQKLYFQGLVLGIWCMQNPPYVETITPVQGSRQLICNFPLAPSIAALVFNGILLIICALFAFMTRQLPDNYNESRFIAFCVYSTILMWFALVPAYMTASTSSLRVGLMSAILILNATVPLVTIFIPKLYAVYFIGTDNLHVKHSTFHRQSSQSQCGGHDGLNSVAPDLVSAAGASGIKERSLNVKTSYLGSLQSHSKVAPASAQDGEATQDQQGWM